MVSYRFHKTPLNVIGEYEWYIRNWDGMGNGNIFLLQRSSGVSILGDAQAISTPLSSVVLFLPDRSFRGWPKSGLIFRTAVVGT